MARNTKTSKNTKTTAARRPAKKDKLAAAQSSITKALTSKHTKRAVGYGAAALGLGFLVSLGVNAAEKAVAAL